MSLKVTGVYFSASSAGPGPGKMKATIRAARQPPLLLPLSPTLPSQQQSTTDGQTPTSHTKGGRLIISTGGHHQHHHHNQRPHHHSQSLDYLHLNFEEKRQIIASSLSLVDFLHPPSSNKPGKPAKPVKVKGIHALRCCYCNFYAIIHKVPPSLSLSLSFSVTSLPSLSFLIAPHRRSSCSEGPEK